MKDVFEKAPVKFFMIGFTLTHWYTTSMKGANRFPKKTAFQDWGQNWVLTIHTAPINGKIALETNY